MLNSIHGQSQSPNTAPLAQWIRNTLWLREGKIHYRVRGNTLHILCEGKLCPEQSPLMIKLLTSLQQTNINTVLEPDSPQIYQILLYGRRKGMQTPTWTVPIYLNQLDQHLEQFQNSPQRQTQTRGGQPVALKESRQGNATTAALVLSNRSLARQGNEAAIAHYLSEVLGALGVAVKVSVKTLPYKPRSAMSIIELSSAPELAIEAKRLWITCEASYSPDPVVLSEPLAQRLRDLELEHFHDAVILIQVRGEEHPDWGLRVDLTPTYEILREWGRWGDAAAIDRILKQPLADRQLELTTTSLKDATLHLFFSTLSFNNTSNSGSSGQAPNAAVVRGIVAPILESLGPQGVQAAALYGSVAGQETPAWVEWLDLPASKYTALAETPLALAQQNDWGAIAFLLNRLINPDLDHYLATGGIRVQALPKGDLLHIMTDAPICPSQEQIGPLVARFFQQLALPTVSGVRVYGRRAGQKRPTWSYGADFYLRDRLVPEAVPEFAATDAFMGDLMTQPSGQIFRPELTSDDLHDAWSRFRQRVLSAIQTALVKTQLFIPETDSAIEQPQSRYQNVGVTALWVAIGLLLATQANWGLRWLLQTIPDPAIAQAPSTEAAPLPNLEQSSLGASGSGFDPTFEQGMDELDPSLEKWQGQAPTDDVFNASGFTSTDSAELPYSEQLSESQGLAAAILAKDLPFSTFNSRQLDEKLLLYQQVLETSGPPDVVIMGSSRALRGVDPVALEAKLASLGYGDISVFNFGINGATAQVVDLIVRGLLTPDQLPKLIIWADGARALNSGALDVTQNGILESEGYQEMTQGKLPLARTYAWGNGSSPQSAIAQESQGLSLTSSYKAVDEWLSDRLASVMPIHDERDRLKSLVQHGLTAAFPSQPPLPVPTAGANPEAGPSAETDVQTEDGQSLVDANGFLPLSVQFNPATYYQTYARVAGAYDSDYADFRVSGQQEDALKALLSFTAAQNIPLVFVNLPLTQEYLDDVRLEYEQQFKQYMLSVAVHQGGLIFRDLGEEWLTQHDYFSDPSHLNRYGAYQVSDRLAQDPMIPWPQP